jgi:hypothetical protein
MRREPLSLCLDARGNAVSNRKYAAVGLRFTCGQAKNAFPAPGIEPSFQSLGRRNPRPQEPFPETNLLSGAGSNGRASLRPKPANDGREGE